MTAYWTSLACRRASGSASSSFSILHGFAEGRQVAAEFFQGVEEEGHALFDHEGIEGQVAAHVGAVVDEVPHDERFLGELLVLQQFGGFGRQLQAR